MESVSALFPGDVIEAWAQDEARLGRLPILRRVWAPIGKRPVAEVHRRYEWLYVYGFVHPVSGRVAWFILPNMRTTTMNIALERFAEEVGAGQGKQVVLFIDGAPSHTSSSLEVPDGIHLVYQPSDIPEVQPSERLWPLIREAVANKVFDSLDALEDALIERCRELDRLAEVIRAHTLFHWWPKDIALL